MENEDIYNKAEEFMINAFTKAGSKHGVIHHQNTAGWVLKLSPGASLALRVAAITHDIERALNGDWKAGSSDPVKLRKHQDLSAEATAGFLKNEGADETFIARVSELIAHHEEGGDDEQNVLCDADALTWLEDNALRHARTYKEKGKTKEEMKEKLGYVFGRITSPEAKETGRVFYERALGELK